MPGFAPLFPSELYETFGRVAIEAFAQQTPVIAARIGAIAEVVTDGVTGLLFEPGNTDDLVSKVRWAVDHPNEMERMGRNARREFEQKYTADQNYHALMAIYDEAITSSRGRNVNGNH
jgi:glycosyltransferase involved in cell wall biosynthesis